MYSGHVSEGISHEEHRTSAWLKHESSALTLIIQDPLLGKKIFRRNPCFGLLSYILTFYEWLSRQGVLNCSPAKCSGKGKVKH